VYELWDDYKEDGYLESGTYRWEREVGLWNETDPGASESPTDSFVWGLELNLEEKSDE
jgi:hypothetical protein